MIVERIVECVYDFRMKLKIAVLFLFIVVAAVYFGFRNFAPVCDLYGGWPIKGNKTRSCECDGKKIVIQDMAPEDGFTITKCFGTIKKATCTQIADDKTSVPCSN